MASKDPNDASYVKKVDNELTPEQMKELFEEEFKEWHHSLVNMALKYGPSCPVGSCLERDVVRDYRVRNAMMDAYWEIVFNDVHPMDRRRRIKQEEADFVEFLERVKDVCDKSTHNMSIKAIDRLVRNKLEDFDDQ